MFETLNLSLKFNREKNIYDDVVEYIDFDFANSKKNWKSTGDYVLILTDATISQFFKLLSIVALSTCKVEYIAIFESRKETAWLGYLLTKLIFQKKSIPVTLYPKKKDSITLLNNFEFYR